MSCGWVVQQRTSWIVSWYGLLYTQLILARLVSTALIPCPPCTNTNLHSFAHNQPHTSPTMSSLSITSFELWPTKNNRGWDSLVSPDPLFGEHWSRVHLYSASALYSYCQWPAPRLLKMDEAKTQANNHTPPWVGVALLSSLAWVPALSLYWLRHLVFKHSYSSPEKPFQLPCFSVKRKLFPFVWPRLPHSLPL